MADVSLEPLKVFCSYSHNDEPLKDELAKHLTMLERQGITSTWHDRKIPPGKEWDQQINENLNTADIILLLVSSDFIFSKYCWDVEVTKAIERHVNGEACVIPIILRNVFWQDAPFAKLQALPRNALPIKSWSNQDDAFTNVAQGIKFAAEQLIKEREQKRVSREAAIAEYRSKAEGFASDGEISLVESDILKDLQEKLKLTDQEASAVREKALEPYGIYKKNLDKYKQYLTRFVDEQGHPLDEKAEAQLETFQKYYLLKDEDVVRLKKEQAIEYQKRQAEILQQQAERLRQEYLEQERAENKRQQAEKLRLEQETAENKRREAELQERLKRESSSPGIQTRPFEFDTATLTPKSAGFLGMGKKTYEINRSRGRAEFFTENLGNGVVLEMVAIPGGKFLMGSPESEPERVSWESPQHQVTIQPFFMGKFTVTQSQWKAVAALPKVNIDLNPEPSNFKGANRPVEQVSWDDAIEFCARLSKKTEKTYRLPSEAEWEYACRTGTTTPFYFGETITTDLANYQGTDWDYNGTVYPGNYAQGPKGEYRNQTTDVGKFPANPFGLFDMHGNIWEWCQDGWHENYNGAPKDGSAWLVDNDNQNNRLLRGGSWASAPRNARSACRGYDARDGRNSGVGFRVVLVRGRT
ncbi:SUMF1/EgtB/PvdO family nonheme iron enzyme [Nostoc sp. TCL240-02]|uniref:SUMF1/EgtB/PvdO family nonheme iron enzyme n=1 Tax=Nostoc sp. TCL240-02 TaxID=2572090 RepID=UPI00157FAF59|nr:SUMF1/EgtB/PvdO family nonheme iron enzyme [Nostoc sp. TCL240-02]QKQ72794.1 TIR domain-containing protein [Nostoc sp. TCL240-02]